MVSTNRETLFTKYSMKTLRPAINYLMAILMAGLFSCSNSGRSDRPKDDGTGHPPSLNQPRNDYGASTNWDEFVKEAVSDGLMEVQMAKIATEKSQNARVKDLAQMIQQDHQEANSRLQELVRTNNMEVPQDMLNKHKAKVNELSNVPQEEFDSRFVEMMIENHRKAINKFQDTSNISRGGGKSADTAPSAEQDGTAGKMDPELKEWINETLPVLKKHLQHAEEVQSQIDSEAKI